MMADGGGGEEAGDSATKGGRESADRDPVGQQQQHKSSQEVEKEEETSRSKKDVDDDDDQDGNDVRGRAIKLAALPVTGFRRDDVWGVLTAVSPQARKRSQGLHVALHNMEHILGRNVKDLNCQFDSPSVSARHCKILRRIVEADGAIKMTQNNVLGPGERFLVFIKDTSSNGTYLNHQRLRKDSPEACLQHGDIISLVAAPEHENAFAFVYREVFVSNVPALQPCSKRKGSVAVDSKDDPVLTEPKRLRGFGVVGSDGPVSLDDVRRLQRANEELRQQLEEHLLTIEKFRTEFRAAETLHDTELKELRSSVTTMFAQQIEDIRSELNRKNRELESYTAVSIQQRSMIEDLNQHIAAGAKSRMEAEEAIQNHKGSIAELEKRLEDERVQSQMEREASEANFRLSLERVRAEAAEEMNRHIEAAARQQKQHLEVISALQEADKENRSIADNLRVKLEEEREARIDAEKRVRKLEIQLLEEKTSSSHLKERVAQLEQELQKAFRQLDGEKMARENALAKVATLELEMETAINNLKLEKQRLEGARERIVLRETQLRAFHSTAEEIAALQQKQQEQLKAMLRTLEDGDGEDRLRTNAVRGSESRWTNDSRRKAMLSEAEDIVSRHYAQDSDIGDHQVMANGEAGKCQGMASGEANKTMNHVTTSIGSLNGNFPKHHNHEMLKEENLEQNKLVGAVRSLLHVELAAAACVQTGNTVKHVVATSEIENKGNYVDAATQLIDVDDGDFGLKIQTIPAENRAQVDESQCDPEYVINEENDTLEDQAELEEDGVVYGETMQLEGEEDGDHTDWERTQAAPEDYGATLLMDTCPAEEENLGTSNHDVHHTQMDMIGNNSTFESSKPVQRDTTSGNEKSLFPATSSRLKAASRRLETNYINRVDMQSLCTADLLASEVAGSWATSMSQHDDNESFHCDERICEESYHNEQGTTDGVNVEFVASQVGTSDSQRARPHLAESPGRSQAGEAVALTLGSQNTPSPKLANKKHGALTEMISIVAPDFEGLDKFVKSISHLSDSENESYKDEDRNNLQDDDTASTHSQPSSRTPSISTP